MNPTASNNVAGSAGAVQWTDTWRPTASASMRGWVGGMLARKKIDRNELANLTAQLAIMTRSGVDVASALESLTRQCRRAALAAVIGDVHQAVLGGATLSQALRQHEHEFGATYIATVAAGEATGRMSHVLGQLAQMQRNELRLRRSIRSLLAYPLLLASVSSLVITALVLFVLPRFAEIFDQYGTPLPTLTRILLSFSSELHTRWWLYGGLAVLALAGLFMLRFSPLCQRARDSFVLNAWLIRDVSRLLLVGRCCRLIGLMIESGVPLLDCLRLARGAVDNVLFRDLFEALEQEVINGRSLAGRLSEADFIPPTASEMIATAERAGSLGEVTRLIGEHFEEEGEAKMRQVVALLEPMITVGMGLIVAVVVLAVMLPMFDLATFAQNN